MSFSVDIVFAGLCADVLDKPRDQNPSKLTVLMPRADSLGYKVNGYPIAPHLPVLIAEGEVFGQGPGKCLQDLSGRDVAFDLHFEGTTPPLTILLDESKESYEHVVEMAYLAPNFAKIKKGCLEEVVPPTDVITRLRLTCGVISTKGLREVEQTFPPLDLPARKVAHRIRWHIPGVDSLTLRASRFGDNADVLRIPITPTSGGSANLVIGNLCDDDLFEFLGGVTPGAGKEKGKDYDFAAYYRLSERDWKLEPAGTLPIPVGPEGGSGKTRCNRVAMLP